MRGRNQQHYRPYYCVKLKFKSVCTYIGTTYIPSFEEILGHRGAHDSDAQEANPWWRGLGH